MLRGELGPGLPGVEIAEQAAAQRFVRDAVRAGKLTAAHDVSEGGIACALAEMAIAGGVGASCDLDALVEARGSSGETAAFGEGPGGFLLAGAPEAVGRLAAEAKEAGVDFWLLGTAGGDAVKLAAAEVDLEVTLAEATAAWRSLAERFRI